jgi:hypothetical protein
VRLTGTENRHKAIQKSDAKVGWPKTAVQNGCWRNESASCSRRVICTVIAVPPLIQNGRKRIMAPREPAEIILESTHLSVSITLMATKKPTHY